MPAVSDARFAPPKLHLPSRFYCRRTKLTDYPLLNLDGTKVVNSFATIPNLLRTASGSCEPCATRLFVVGTENRLADFAIRASVGRERASGRATQYNPVVLCGPAGVGKSHLAHALATAWPAARELNTAVQSTVVQWTGADFYRQVASAIQSDSLATFRRRFSTVSLLVIDDIELLTGKTSAQNELIRLIDDLGEQGDLTQQRMLLVITAQQPPRQITALSPALRSRLSAGLVVAVAPPSEDSRLKIVRHLASERHFALSEAAAKLMAKQIEGTARDLLSGLLELNMTSKSANQSSSQQGSSLRGSSLEGPSLQATRDYLARQAVTAQPTLIQIITTTARRFSLPPAVLKSASRSQLVVTARGIAIFLSRELTDHSFQEIGCFLGDRDHTTILHNDRKIRRLVGQDPEIAQTIRDLRAEILERGKHPGC